jgi:hypothetical protein
VEGGDKSPAPGENPGASDDELRERFEQRENERVEAVARGEGLAFDDPAAHPAVLRMMAKRLDALNKQLIIVERSSLAPPPGPESIPVRAIKKTYTLSRGAAAVVGVLWALAEALTPEVSIIRVILRAIFDAPP